MSEQNNPFMPNVAFPCKCGGKPFLKEMKWPNPLYSFKCDRCGKTSAWSRDLHKAIGFWNEVAKK